MQPHADSVSAAEVNNVKWHKTQMFHQRRVDKDARPSTLRPAARRCVRRLRLGWQLVYGFCTETQSASVCVSSGPWVESLEESVLAQSEEINRDRSGAEEEEGTPRILTNHRFPKQQSSVNRKESFDKIRV